MTCESDPTAGCSDESLIVSAINTCCTTTNNNLTLQNTKLDAIKTSIDDCCVSQNEKFDEMIALLTTIAAK